MSNNDKALAGMAIAAVVLAIVAFAVALRQPAPEYLPTESSPEDVVNNYLLALRLGENERAYGYLSDSLDGYPQDVETFVEDMAQQRWEFPVQESAVAYTISDADVTGDVAVVTVEETRFNESGLFDSGQVSEDFVMSLRDAGGEWRLTHGERYWSECWDAPDSDRCRRNVGDEEADPGANDGSGSNATSGEENAP
jgi:hypothetical protein